MKEKLLKVFKLLFKIILIYTILSLVLEILNEFIFEFPDNIYSIIMWLYYILLDYIIPFVLTSISLITGILCLINKQIKKAFLYFIPFIIVLCIAIFMISYERIQISNECKFYNKENITIKGKDGVCPDGCYVIYVYETVDTWCCCSNKK